VGTEAEQDVIVFRGGFGDGAGTLANGEGIGESEGRT